MDICLGIDVGQYSVKIAEVGFGSRGYELLHGQEFVLNKNDRSDVQIELIDILRNISSLYKNKDVKIVWGLSQSSVGQDLCYFPFRERYKILKSIAFELEDSLPFSAENAVFDATITRFIGHRSEVLASACPKERIKQQMSLATDGLIEPDFMSVEGLALANLFTSWQEPPVVDVHSSLPPASFEEIFVEDSSATPRETKLILNMGHEKTVALFMASDHIVDVRIVDWSAKDLIRFIAQENQLSFLEATKALQAFKKIYIKKEAITPHEEVFSNYIKESLTILCQQVSLVILETEARTQILCKSIYLTGGLSRIVNLGAVISQKLKLPTNKLQQFYMKPQVDLKGAVNEPNVFTVAIGLAIEGFKRAKNPPSNLLKGEFSRDNESFSLFWQRWSHTLKVVAAAIVLFFVYSLVRNNLSDEISQKSYSNLRTQTKKIAKLKGRSANLSGAKKYINEQKRVIKNLEVAQSLQKTTSALDFLKDFSINFLDQSKKINIMEFAFKNDQLQVSGRALGSAPVFALEKKLKSLSNSGKVKKRDFNPTQKKKGWVYFGFSTQVKGL